MYVFDANGLLLGNGLRDARKDHGVTSDLIDRLAKSKFLDLIQIVYSLVINLNLLLLVKKGALIGILIATPVHPIDIHGLVHIFDHLTRLSQLLLLLHLISILCIIQLLKYLLLLLYLKIKLIQILDLVGHTLLQHLYLLILCM